MGWTYGGDPLNSPRDRLRLLIGDTDAADPQLQDGEIDFYLADNRSPYGAAARACEGLAAKYSRQVSKSLGQVSVQAAERAKAYMALAAKLQRRSSVTRALPLVGGRLRSEKNEFASDYDLLKSPLVIEDDHARAPECGAEVIGIIPLGSK